MPRLGYQYQFSTKPTTTNAAGAAGYGASKREGGACVRTHAHMLACMRARRRTHALARTRQEHAACVHTHAAHKVQVRRCSVSKHASSDACTRTQACLHMFARIHTQAALA